VNGHLCPDETWPGGTGGRRGSGTSSPGATPSVRWATSRCSARVCSTASRCSSPAPAWSITPSVLTPRERSYLEPHGEQAIASMPLESGPSHRATVLVIRQVEGNPKYAIGTFSDGRVKHHRALLAAPSRVRVLATSRDRVPGKSGRHCLPGPSMLLQAGSATYWRFRRPARSGPGLRGRQRDMGVRGAGLPPAGDVRWPSSPAAARAEVMSVEQIAACRHGRFRS
jgi:hypothetical protein